MEKIQELTEKIYREGVERGQVEAERIIEAAKQQAEEIMETAKQQAETIQQQAKKQAQETDANTRNELRLFISQALNALKSEITNVLSDEVVSNSVQKMTSDGDFLKKFALGLASKWVESEPVTISTSDAEGLKAYFAKEAKEVLDKGVKIEQVNNIKTLFTIAPQDGSYKVEFGKEQFESYFKAFLRPQLVEMLF